MARASEANVSTTSPSTTHRGVLGPQLVRGGFLWWCAGLSCSCGRARQGVGTAGKGSSDNSDPQICHRKHPPSRQPRDRPVLLTAIQGPLGGAPVVTTSVIAGIILQSKEALAQRLTVLQQGVRQMVLEAAQLAHQEQMLDVAKYQQLIDAGPEASSAAAVGHAEHGLLFTNEVAECLQLITTEPDMHYGLFFGGLNWKSGRAFCLTANIGIPHGPARNKTVGQLLRDGFTATIVRVFDSASSTGQVHFEAMALARSSIDRLLRTGVLPPSMVDRLQCTLVGQPMRLMEPSAAAHAAVTPTTLRARLHTASMWEGHFSNYAYDQMDRHQMNTLNEVSGESSTSGTKPRPTKWCRTFWTSQNMNASASTSR